MIVFTELLTYKEHCLKMMAPSDKGFPSLLPVGNPCFCVAHKKRRGDTVFFLKFCNLTRLTKPGDENGQEEALIMCVYTHELKKCRLRAQLATKGSEEHRGYIILALQLHLWLGLLNHEQGKPRTDPCISWDMLALPMPGYTSVLAAEHALGVSQAFGSTPPFPPSPCLHQSPCWPWVCCSPLLWHLFSTPHSESLGAKFALLSSFLCHILSGIHRTCPDVNQFIHKG